MEQSSAEKRRAYRAQYYAKNKEKILAKNAQWAKENPEKVKAYSKAAQARMRQANPEKVKAIERRYRENSPEKVRAKAARYWAKNKEKKKEKDARYRTKHAERVKSGLKQYQEKNAEKIREYKQRYYAENLAEIKEKHRIYQQQNPEIFRAISKRREARERGAILSDFTAAQWAAMKQQYHYRCVYCGKKSQRLTQDHLTPLSKGGAHTMSNIVPACRSCNSRKGIGAVLRPVQPALVLTAPETLAKGGSR